MGLGGNKLPGSVAPAPAQVPARTEKDVSHANKSKKDNKDVKMSEFLRRTLKKLPLYPRPPTWRLCVWQLMCGGRHGSLLASISATGSMLKGVLDSENVNQMCICFMDVATTLGTALYQVTFTNNRSNTRKMLEELIDLSERLEAVATPEQLQDMATTVRKMRRVVTFLSTFVVTVLSLMLSTPLLVGELTMSFYPTPHGPFWLFVCFAQEVATLTSSLCVGTIMTTLMLISYGVASLARVVALQLQAARGEPALRELSKLHREVLDVGEAMPQTYFLTLFFLISGYLSVSLFGTYNMATGSSDPYTVSIVPAALLFYYNIALICDVLYAATDGVSEGAYGSEWMDEPPEVRRLLGILMTRAQRPAAVRVFMYGAITLPVFMATMQQWWSFLQMIRNISK